MRHHIVVSTLVLPSLVLGVARSAGNTEQTPAAQTQTWESCEEMHDTYVRRFESSSGFGPSRMYRPLMLDKSGIVDLGRSRYSIESLELIGLLKHDAPVAYVVRHEMRGISRELTDFELTSLAKFRAGAGMATSADKDSGVLSCVGALRAKDECLSCHKDKKAGDLVGAFTYKLVSARGAAGGRHFAR